MAGRHKILTGIEYCFSPAKVRIMLWAYCHVDESREAGEGDICILAMERGMMKDLQIKPLK